ncbi:MAG: hypothetical protein FWD83_05935 [Promicromonosporaceae bacterium]|nr:hypothetical protein [Promicromonosporaceae bacterium]
MSSDPRDTLRIVGGSSPTEVDAAAIWDAAGRMRYAGDRLSHAVWQLNRAADSLDRKAWTQTHPSFTTGTGSATAAGDTSAVACITPPAMAAVITARSLYSLAKRSRDAAIPLGSQANECYLLHDRLLRAAGLYEQGESWVHRVIGTVFAPQLTVCLLLGIALPGKAGDLLTRTVAPWSDEAISHLGRTLALVTFPLNGGDISVSGTARTLSGVLGLGRDSKTATVYRVPPRSAGLAWDDASEGTIFEALTRLPRLTGSGVPAGTLAVQKVTHADGTVAWVVLIPGTQSVLVSDHVFDGLSDVNLIAGESSAIMMAVDAALADLGVQPDEPVVLVGHSLGGITAAALASSAEFTTKYQVGGVVTAGSPTATFEILPGIPVLHLENDEELVSNLDGKAGEENPQTPDRVTVTRSLAASSAAADLAAVGSISAAHGVGTHLRTLEAALVSENVQVAEVTGRIETLMQGETTETTFYATERGRKEVVDEDEQPTKVER